jgi:hypothetical protein
MSVCRVRGPGTELLHTLFGVVGLDRRIAVPGSALAKQALVSAVGHVVGDDPELRHGALARRSGIGSTGVCHLQRDVDGGQQARLCRNSLTGDIEGRAVVDRGADNRQAIADVDA